MNNRVSVRADLLEQVITLEEEVEKLVRENALLKEHLDRENAVLSARIVESISQKIDGATSAVLAQLGGAAAAAAARAQEAPAGLGPADIAPLGQYSRDIALVFRDLETEVQNLWTLCYQLAKESEEKDKHLKMYAVVNEELTKIKEEYVKLKYARGG